MSEKNLSIVVVAHQPYVRHICKEGELPGAENDIFFGALSQTYVPLVNLLNKLEAENIDSKFSIVLSPVLCSMLDDEVLQSQYVEWLDRCIVLGQKEKERLASCPELLKNAEEQLEKIVQTRKDFVEKYECNLLRQFAGFAKRGRIEILASCGTHAFLPHYADMPEVLNAQVETGIMSHRHFFGRAPDGFWLPYMGYVKGIERTLRSYGINYTVLDTHGILFSENAPKTGIFVPDRCWNSLVVFGRDGEASQKINGCEGFSSNPVYKNQEKDIGFELEESELEGFLPPDSPRSNTLFRYWSKKDDSDSPYDSKKALEQAKVDAAAFLDEENQKLEKASKYLENPVLVCTIEAAALGQCWAEGMDFFEEVLRKNASSKFVATGDLIKDQFKLEKITPYPSAASGTGYGEDLLDSSNSWMLRYTRKMCERMVDLSGRFPDDTGLKVRLLVLGAKELMLAQSGELAKMIHSGVFSDFARESFTKSVIDFTKVFDALGSNTVSTEWLTKLEKEHNFFPWLNYRIFCRKQ